MTPYFEFANPTKLCSGAGAVDNLGYELEILGVHNPLLLSDAVLEKIGTLSLVIKALQEKKNRQDFYRCSAGQQRRDGQ